jgi:hypothetical protein
MDVARKSKSEATATEQREPGPDGSGQREDKLRRLRRYSIVVTVSLILICNAIFLLGLWGSGVNLETVIKTPEEFNPTTDICLRLSWHKVSGADQPVQLCAEWIHLSDPSGETHSFQRETQVVKGADGNLYFDHGRLADYRLVVFLGSVVGLMALGVMAKRRLITHYRRRLGLSKEQASEHNS